MSSHRIHLKGPWQYCLLSATGAEAAPATGELNSAGRIKLPADWQESFGDYRGSVRYERHFNCPTNLDSDERVYVIFTEIGGTATVTLNETELGSTDGGPGPFEFEIKGLLHPRNLLVVDVEFTALGEPGGLWTAVALEIRSD